MLWWILVLLLVLLFLFFLLVSSVRILLVYEKDGFQTKLRYTFFSYSLYPQKEKGVKESDFTNRALKKTQRKEKRKAVRLAGKQAKKKNQTPPGPAPQKKSPAQLLQMVRDLYTAFADLPKKLLRHLRIKSAHLHIKIGTEQAAQTALLTGAVIEAVSATELFLQENLRYERAKKAEFFVVPAYTQEDSEVSAQVEFRLRLFWALVLAWQGLFRYLNFKNQKQITDKEA